MEKEEMENVARFVRNSSVNVQLEWALSMEGEQMNVMRATPWRNSFNPNRMILVAAETLDEALVMLATELQASRWQRLDWKARPVEFGVYEPIPLQIPDLLERTALLRQRAAEDRRKGTNPSRTEENGVHEPF